MNCCLRDDFNLFLGGPLLVRIAGSFSDSSLDDGSVLSDLESESSIELDDSAGCEDDPPEDVSDLDRVEVSVTDAGRADEV